MSKRKNFGSPASLHRSNAGSISKDVRRFAQAARTQAKHGDCRSALHLFGVVAYHAGQAAAERGHTGRRGYRGGSRMGSRVLGLQKTIFRLCKVGR